MSRNFKKKNQYITFGATFMKQLLSKCPVCINGNMYIEKIDEFIREGNDTILLEVEVEKCDRCGEHYYDGKTIRYIEKIRKELKDKNSRINSKFQTNHSSFCEPYNGVYVLRDRKNGLPT